MPACIACRYAFNVALATTRLINAVLGGDPSEALCARAARAERRGSLAGAMFCRVVGWVHREHCAWSLNETTSDIVRTSANA